MKNNVRKMVLDELANNVANMEGLEIGSEEYLNAAKANNQQAEAAQKLKAVDPMQIVNLAVSLACVVITIAASEAHILDTRPVTFIRGLFRR